MYERMRKIISNIESLGNCNNPGETMMGKKNDYTAICWNYFICAFLAFKLLT